MTAQFPRRSLLLSAGAGLSLAGAAMAAAPFGTIRNGRQKTLRHAAIGVGGMGRSDLGQIASHPNVKVVALCDVDSKMIENAREFAPGAREFADYRELFKEMAGEIDSVSVSTPDHMHAAISMEAMKHGLHVYCQKPLTQTVAESRAMAKRAKESGVVTQMGIQNHSRLQLRTAKQLFDQDLIGKVHSVHVWTDRPNGWWAQGEGRPEGTDPVPENLDWDLWLGIAPERPYKQGAYHPFQWRGREDFGTGAQGDMACHLMDPATWFLGLGFPTSIRSEGPTPNGETFPLWSQVRYEFEANEHTTRGPLVLTWTDGKRKPPVDVLAGIGSTREEFPANGCLFMGTKGALLADPYGEQRLFPAEDHAGVEIPQLSHNNHWHNWVDACLGKAEPVAPFEYAAKLTEVALLGNVALRFPHETLYYDGEAMSFRGRPDANAFLTPKVRTGWAIDGM